jgi:ribosomal protein L37E
MPGGVCALAKRLEDVLMEARRFDTVAKLIGRGATRRRLLGGLLGSVGGAAVFGRAHEAFAASACAPLRRCGKDCYNPKEFTCCSCGNGVKTLVPAGSSCKKNALCPS